MAGSSGYTIEDAPKGYSIDEEKKPEFPTEQQALANPPVDTAGNLPWRTGLTSEPAYQAESDQRGERGFKASRQPTPFTDVAGAMLGPEAAANVVGELPGAAGVARALRTEKGALKPWVRQLSRAAGAGLGYKVGGYPGAIVGGLSATGLADVAVPGLPPEMPTPSPFSGMTSSAGRPSVGVSGVAAGEPAVVPPQTPEPPPSPFTGMTSTAGRPSVAVSGGYTAPEPVISIREPKGAARVAPRGSNGQEPLVLTPEEARSEAQLQRIATSRASERGMQYAGGVRTAGPNRVANRLFPAGVTRDFGVEAPATPRTARPSPVPISEPAVAAREYAATNIPSPDTLADRMVAKGMDPNFADRRAKDLVEAASGNGKWTGTERRVAENQIKNYMGPERRRP